MADPRPVPRTVKPRRTGFTYLPLLVIDQDRDVAIWEPVFTKTGELWSAEEVCEKFLPTYPSSLIVAPDAARLLVLLDSIYGRNPTWQYRVTPFRHHVMKTNGELSSWKVTQTVVNFLGWQTPGKQANRYHYPVDPFQFSRSTLRDLLPPSMGDDDADRPLRLLTWGQDLRAWCQENDLRFSASAGGLAAQLLRDKRFFPKARRKVPRATNARVRPRLPGNFYHLYGEVNRPYQAWYLDMKSAHHTIASTITFPDPDSLNARGFFDVSDVPGVTVTDGRPWLRQGTRGFNRIMDEGIGLIYACVNVPTLRPDRTFPPPYMMHRGRRMMWLYTNELPTVRALGGVIEHITAAWVSFGRDDGLNRYAAYAIEQLAQAEADRKRWLKPTLLATYGILAAQPRAMETGYKRAKAGEPRAYPAGSGLIRAQAMVGRELETPIVNVMYRGLIEAEQRIRALDLARSLHGYGFRVLAIYADSVFVETGPPLPFLPDGWRVEAQLDGLFFSSATHFTSRQLTKLPGVPRESSERVQIVAAMRGEIHGVGHHGWDGPRVPWSHKQR